MDYKLAVSRSVSWSVALSVRVSAVSISTRSDSIRARQLYKNISMLFPFPVIDGKLSTGVIQYLMHHATVSLQQSKITLQNNCINNTSITQPTLSFYF